ncbi:MAG: hypothetical protein HRU38_23295 [Saccharospirillaceae bacterium]|nr:hypothetical protein [Saccharospirillaceae bacterium]
MAKCGKSERMIYGVQSPRDDWFIRQLDKVVDAGERHIDGLSIEMKGVEQGFKPLIKVHGLLNTTQLRLLADDLENTPNSPGQ